MKPITSNGIKVTSTPAPRMCAHRISSLPYIAAHQDADRRMKRGERQRICPVCLKWIWDSEFKTKGFA